jgi:hypothetical protein
MKGKGAEIANKQQQSSKKVDNIPPAKGKPGADGKSANANESSNQKGKVDSKKDSKKSEIQKMIDANKARLSKQKTRF